MIPAPYYHVLQAVVVKDTVVDTFTGCALTVYFPVFFGIPWNPWAETELPIILYINGASIAARGTFFRMGTGIYAPTF